MTVSKAVAAIVAAAVSFFLSAPESLHRVAGVALWFVVVDSVSGVVAARFAGQMTSTVFRTKLRDKVSCYASLLALCGGVGVLASSWAWVVAGFWAICGAEGLSIVENTRCLLRGAGPQLAPVAQLLDRLTGFLSAADKTPTDQPPSA